MIRSYTRTSGRWLHLANADHRSLVRLAYRRMRTAGIPRRVAADACVDMLYAGQFATVERVR